MNSARCGHVLLWFSQEICHLITMNVQTRINSLYHLFFVEQSHGLCFTFELQCVDKLISQDGMRTKLNNHGMTFWSELHGVKSFDSLIIHENRDGTTDCVPPCQLSHHRIDSYYFCPRITGGCCYFCILIVAGMNFLCENFATNVQLYFKFHDYQMCVQRVWFALVILPSFNMLSHTLTKTWNFCSLVSVSAPSHFDITLSICAFDLIIFCSECVCQ